MDGVGATILTERVEYLDENGRLVTESLRDFTRKALKKRFTIPCRYTTEQADISKTRNT